MAARQDLSPEYTSRLNRNRDVPAEVARGHGVVPIGIARKIEHQEELTAAERKRYASGIAQYEEKYGPATGRIPARHTIKERFDSEEEAEGFLEDKGIPENYVQIRHTGSGWAVVVLR